MMTQRKMVQLIHDREQFSLQQPFTWHRDIIDIKEHRVHCLERSCPKSSELTRIFVQSLVLFHFIDFEFSRLCGHCMIQNGDQHSGCQPTLRALSI